MAQSDLWGEVRQAVLAVFGEDLKDLRTDAGMTHRVLGERSQMHGTEIGLLERGQREPRLGTMIRLAVALDVPFERLTETPVGRFEFHAARSRQTR
jgi:transcriptional regulator with XRE-family HTH domain